MSEIRVIMRVKITSLHHYITTPHTVMQCSVVEWREDLRGGRPLGAGGPGPLGGPLPAGAPGAPPI